MKLEQFYKNLKHKDRFYDFLESFLTEILPDGTDISPYKASILEYLFYDKKDFLHQIKYNTFGVINSEYLEKLFVNIQKNNPKWVDFVWSCCQDKTELKEILTLLGNKKVEVLQTITMSSFKSLENDVKNSEIVTNMLNSIVEHLQEMQKNQNMMLANISHEMRTPLNSVIGYLDILDSMTNLSIEERKNVTYAKNSSKLLLTLINDLLDTQKLSNATLDLINNPFWINKIIKNAVMISNINANQKNIDFIFVDKTSIFSEVMGDKNRFLQILNNLFSNAVKFTPENGKVEVVATSEDLGDKIRLKLTVKDSGIGIQKEKQNGLFKPFSRATNKEKGTGLGLYISKQLANRMGGDIWFQSEEGKGSTFYVELLFEKSKTHYEKTILKHRNIIILKSNELSEYCNNLAIQLKEIGSKVKIFNDENKFIQFLMFNKGIDMVIIVYPHPLSKDDLDMSFIKTYKKINENSNIETYFVAGIDENSYPNKPEIFNNIINTPITILDIIEVFSDTKTQQKNYKYLIIDDEPMNRMVLTTMLNTFDKQAIIETANDGVEGLAKIKNDNYDLIFLDKRMPNMGGYEVLEEVRKLNIKTNIYLLTADGDNETIEKAKEYNVGYIAKPVTLSTLKSVVGNLTGGGDDIRINEE